MEGLVKFAEMSIKSTESIMKVQIDAAREVLEETAAMARALSEVKKPEELVALRIKLAAKSSERMMSYSRQIFDTAMRSRSELMDLVNHRLSGVSQDFAAATGKAFKLPEGFEASPFG